MRKIISNKKYLIFSILSILFLGFMVSFYGYRLIHFYLIENPSGSKLKENVNLVDVIINDNKIVSDGDGLYFDDNNNYIFKGKVDSNYLYYSGILWRIVRINKDKSIKLVSEEILTKLYWDNTNKFEDSTLNIWVNNKILNKLAHNDYLINVNSCVDVIDNVDNSICNNYFDKQKIGFLSVDEYISALGKQSYLNNSKAYWLSNSDNNGKMWYVNNDGGVSNINSDGNYGIRATITLKPGIVRVTGDGQINTPYTIELDQYQNLSQINIGMYLKYGDYVWRVIDKLDNSVKVVLDGYLKDERNFGGYNNLYSNSDINKYLNNNFYNSLTNKEYIIKNDYYNGEYNNFDYQNALAGKVSANIGLLSIGDLFVSEYNNIFLMNPYDNEEMIYTIDNNYNLYGNSIKTSLKIRPVIHLDSSLLIKNGKGYKNEPFEISK